MIKIRRKGFTLVELLAVIVILAIILAIAIPSITNITTNSRKNAFEANVKLILRGMDYKNLETPGTVVAATGVAVSTLSSYGANPSDYTGTFTITVSSGIIGISGLTTASGGKFSGCSITGTATYTSTTVTCS